MDGILPRPNQPPDKLRFMEICCISSADSARSLHLVYLVLNQKAGAGT